MATNLLPAFSAWQTQTPDWKPLAKFDCEGNSASITLCSNAYGTGKWHVNVPVAPGWYDFSVECRTAAMLTDIWVLLTVHKANGKWYTREHAKTAVQTADGYRFAEKIEVPEDCVSIEAELWLKGYFEKVTWFNPVLTEGEAVKPRPVKIALGFVRPTHNTLEENGAKLLNIVDKAGAMNPDIILLSECMYERSVPVPLVEKAETQDGYMVTTMRERAKKYHCYLIYNLHEHEGTEIYNSSLLIDREGNIVGKYRKTHLTVGEIEMGMTPGNSHPVFDTDFGRIGMMTCWDQYFTEPAKYLVEKGAEIIFVPSAGDAKEKSHARAMDHGVYMAICGMNLHNTYGWGAARIVAPDGEIVAQTDEDETVAFAEIDLAKPVRIFWLSVGAADSKPHEDYRFEKNPHSYF